jgi:retron-type reverse transcriptase
MLTRYKKTHTHTRILPFVDLLNDFDNVNWKVMMNKLKMIKTDYRNIIIIRELHKHETTCIKVKSSKRKAAIRKGVRQGCNLRPLLMNSYIEQATNECKEYCTEIEVNGMMLQMLRFADVTAIIA